MKEFFRCKYNWQSVYFQKWCKDRSWEKILQIIQSKYKYLLDLSGIQLDGTHTPTKRGDEAVAYYTNCILKCRVQILEFAKVNADRPTKEQIECNKNMRHLVG